ncbi:hypothetical protein FHG87_025957, partial [Trinorchestia longiramus]
PAKRLGIRYDVTRAQDTRIPGSTTSAEPSQPPNIRRLQRSVSRILHQAVPKSTSTPKTLIT